MASKTDKLFIQIVPKGFKVAGNNLTNMRKSLVSIKGLIGGLVAGYAIKKLGEAFLDAAKKTEQLQVRLQVLLGSVEEGNRLFKNMTKYASQVPFEFEQIMDSATMLSGIMKDGVDEVTKWMPLIGDLAAAVGFTILETTEQIQRMLSAGAASADRFRERGVLAMLGFTAGVAYSAKETERMLIESWERTDSKFRGATDKLANTWSGQISMMADKWYKFRMIVMDSNVFKQMTKSLTFLNTKLEKLLSENEIAIGNWARNAAIQIIGIGQSAMTVITVVAKSIDGFLSLPGWLQASGLIGAFLFGKTGALVLMGLSTVVGNFDDIVKLSATLQGRILAIIASTKGLSKPIRKWAREGVAKMAAVIRHIELAPSKINSLKSSLTIFLEKLKEDLVIIGSDDPSQEGSIASVNEQFDFTVSKIAFIGTQTRATWRIWAEYFKNMVGGWQNLGDEMAFAMERAMLANKNFFQAVARNFKDMLNKMLAAMAARAVIFSVLDFLTGGGFSKAVGGFKVFMGFKEAAEGMQEGGYTGDIGGIVHKHEYVIPEWMVAKMPGTIAGLEAVRAGGGSNVTNNINLSQGGMSDRQWFRDSFVPMFRDAQRSGML